MGWLRPRFDIGDWRRLIGGPVFLAGQFGLLFYALSDAFDDFIELAEDLVARLFLIRENLADDFSRTAQNMHPSGRCHRVMKTPVC